MRTFLVLFSVFVLCVPEIFCQEQKKSRDQMVRDDRNKVEGEGFWVYNDLDTAFARAKQTGKPLLVVLRCIPCQECVKLDDELVDRDPIVRSLLEKFVCARVVSTNGLDLSLFQFDTDQSFAVFMLNADRTIYGRFGTRSHRTEWVGDVSLKGLAAALAGALELHADYPGNKALLAGKSGTSPLFRSPELFPSLSEKYTNCLNETGEVAKSCIHCHQIGDAVRDYYRGRGEPIPEDVLSPYPHPKSLGLILDPNSRATVREVLPNSISDSAGLKAGDHIQSFGDQAILSMADVQWVLHGLPSDGQTAPVKVLRGTAEVALSLTLPSGWRRLDNISWRASSWGLRRMATGGLLLEAVADSERGIDGIPEAGMALRIEHVGQYGPHATAQKQGFQKDDVVVSYDGRTDLLTDADVLRHGVTSGKPGDVIEVEVIRKGQRNRLKLPLQP